MRYTWQEDQSALREVVFSGKAKAINEAVIYAPDSLTQNAANNPALLDLDEYLVKRGLTVSYDQIEGRAMLRVAGFKRDEELLSALQEGGFVGGAARTEASAQEEAPSKWEQVKKNSLFLSASFYMLGNIATALSGYLRRDNAELTSGAAFSVGDISMLLFAHRDDKAKHQAVMRGFSEKLRENGYMTEFGSTFSPAAVEETPSTWGRIKNFMHDKVIAIKSVSEIIAGTSLAKAGLQQKNAYKTAAGTLIGSGFALGLVIPEKSSSQIRDDLGANTPEEAQEKMAQLSGFEKVKYKIMSQPLILPGTFAALNNVSAILGAFDERKNQRQVQMLKAELNGGTYQTAILGFKQDHTIDGGGAEAALAAAKNRYNSSHNHSDRDTNRTAYEAALGKRNKFDRELKNLTTDSRHKDLISPKNFWVFNLLQGGLFLVANTLYSMSSKSGGRSKSEEVLAKRYVAAVTTEALKSPTEMEREDIINLAANYAGNLHELDFTAKEVRSMIEDQIIALENHPWLKRDQARASQWIVEEQTIPLQVTIDIENSPTSDKTTKDTIETAAQTTIESQDNATVSPTARSILADKITQMRQNSVTPETAQIKNVDDYRQNYRPVKSDALKVDQSTQGKTWEEKAPAEENLVTVAF